MSCRRSISFTRACPTVPVAPTIKIFCLISAPQSKPTSRPTAASKPSSRVFRNTHPTQCFFGLRFRATISRVAWDLATQKIGLQSSCLLSVNVFGQEREYVIRDCLRLVLQGEMASVEQMD